MYHIGQVVYHRFLHQFLVYGGFDLNREDGKHLLFFYIKSNDVVDTFWGEFKDINPTRFTVDNCFKKFFFGKMNIEKVLNSKVWVEKIKRTIEYADNRKFKSKSKTTVGSRS